jgi:hypothetical protein
LLALGGKKKSGRLNRQIEQEVWRLLASLEHLPATTRAALGTHLLAKVRKEPEDGAWLWSLGRLGARIPLYGPLSCVVAPETAAQWLGALLELSSIAPESAYAITQLGRLTSDRQRDIDGALRQAAIERLSACGAEAGVIERLSIFTPPETWEASRMFGDLLPPGLHLVSSASCLLSVPALAPEKAVNFR